MHSFPTRTVIRTVLTIWLAACLGVFIVRSIHWPQVNDPAQISYLCFLMDHGFAPYRYLIEMNMPGIYLTNWSVAHLLGAGSLAWRAFDLLLISAACAAMICMARIYDWLYGFFAAAIFILFHGQDGPAQLGQRDFIVTVLFLCAYAFLFEALRQDKKWLLFFFGICSAAPITYKPQALLLTLFLLVALCWRLRSQQKPFLRPAMLSVAGMAVPILLVLGFLLEQHALKAFVVTERTLLPYYAVLGRHSVPSLLRLLLVNSIGALLLLGIVIALLQRHKWTWERTLLVAGILFGATSDIAQGKGFLYHRYPFAAFVLLWVAIEFATAERTAGMPRKLAYAGLLYGAIIAGIFTSRASVRTWDETYNQALRQDLISLGGSKLSGSVQCITMSPDCATTLHRLRLLQSTGLVYDYFIFGPNNYPAVAYVRQRFWDQFIDNRPRVIIVGRWLYPEQADDYSKLNRWPAFRDYLSQHYTLVAERSFPPPKRRTLGYGYRIYVLR
ncbi:MAG TPA: hypothetical protein VMF56_14320 [Acidobacteriaceae bacterium]|nr:hypothetical protein [Acidobacteriaceae bacterium]